MEQMTESQCKSKIKFGDDYGDNVTTFHCQLKEGHEGPHVETGNMYGQQDYEVKWKGECLERDSPDYLEPE
jgi:hypothetical protein